MPTPAGTLVITKLDEVDAVGPLFVDRISFPGDTAMAAGGTPGFQAQVAAIIGKGRVLVGVHQAGICGGYVPVWDSVNDKLSVYYGDNNNASDGPLIEVPTTPDLSGTTFVLTVISK